MKPPVPTSKAWGSLAITQFGRLALALLVMLAAVPADAARPVSPSLSAPYVGDGEIGLGWRSFGSDRSSITHFKVQWKSENQEYSTVRQRVVNAYLITTQAKRNLSSICGVLSAT